MVFFLLVISPEIRLAFCFTLYLYLDESFNDNLFSVDGYKVQRRDRNQYGGGLLTFIRSDFPSSRKQSLESEKIETLCHEVYISDRKWLIAGAYKPPSMSNNEFTEHFSSCRSQEIS